MSNPTSNYAFQMPTPTDLVTDLPADFEVFGQAVDTSLWNVGFGQAGKNKIINGDFAINQRNFTSTTTSNTYGFDRFVFTYSDGTSTHSAQTFTAGTAPVAGYEAANYCRTVTTGQTLASAFTTVSQRIENVRTFAGQTVTVSFWAKAASGTPKIGVELAQNFGTGGSPSAQVNTLAGTPTISTSWARYSVSVAVPSISGKTIGTTTPGQVNTTFWLSAGTDFNSRTGSIGIQSNTFDIWGVQVEAGSTATPFQTASGGSPQAELAMCQRYYYRATFDSTANRFGVGTAWTATQFFLTVPFPVTMRTKPTALEQSGTATDYSIVAGGSTLTCSAVPAFFTAHPNQAVAELTVAAGLTSGWAGFMRNASTNAYLGWSAEL